MSPVTVDLFLFEKASEAAFLNILDPAMHPKTVGFLQLNKNIITDLSITGPAYWNTEHKNICC